MAQSFAPAIRIVDKIDESNLVTLKGNTHPAAIARNDRGRVSPSLPMTGLILVLSRSAEQQAAFEKFVASQYDSSSPNFHQWLTPEQIGENFGPSQTDIATVSNWLIQHGFSVDEVTKDRMSIRFSGTATQVESAFHTEIHNLEVKGVAHIGNMSDPQIPAALAPAVVGVKALHNFFPRPLHRLGSAVTRDSATGKWERPTGGTLSAAAKSAGVRPQFGINVPGSGGNQGYLVEDVAPYDFATIYNVLPLWNASTPIDGTGEIIAIAGTSSIKTSDVATFRTAFGLPTSNAANTPILQTGNGQALTVCTASASSSAYCTIDDQVENALDVEWAGSIAKNAQIVLVASSQASSSDDTLYDSESYIVNNVSNSTSPVYNAHIMNVSYGECELGMGTAGNVEYYNLWQTAASEGIAVFVASGDAGAAGCDQGGDATYGVPYAAEYGLSVNGLASTPYNTAVGGTDFNWCSMTSSTECTPAPYWSTSNATTGASALGYVPEVPWNDTCTSPLALTYMESFFAAVTSVTDAETGCNAIVNYAQSIYNQGYGFMLDYVDTVGGGGGASSCVVNDGSDVSSCSGASVATNGGSIALVNDGWPKPAWQAGVAGIPTDGVRDIPDVSFFASDGFLSSSAYLVCVSDAATCTYSTKTEPTAQEVGGTSVATPAMAGVMALINQKTHASQGSPNQQLYELAARQGYSNCSAETATNSNGCYFNDIDTGTIAMACDDGDFGYVSPNCTVIHAADQGGVGILSGYSAGTGYDLATGLGSLNVANVVNNWPVAGGVAAATVAVSPASSTITADQSLIVTVTVASTATGGATPTGTVTLASGSNTSYTSSETLSSGSYQFTIPGNSLAVGSDTLTATYWGNGSYALETGTASVSVTESSTSTATFSLSPTTPTAISSPGGSTTSTITVSTNTGYAGTVILTCALTAYPSGASYLPSCSISATSVTLSSTATSGKATATINTTAATSGELVYPKLPGKSRGLFGAAGGALLAFVVFLGIPARRRSWRSMLGVLVLMAMLGSLAACGGSSSSSTGTGGTTPGTYTFTVTGTGNDVNKTVETTTFSVRVD